MVSNARALAYNSVARPVMAAAMCGMIPSVHANAAITLARAPWARPAARVYSTPIPGDATTMKVVIRNSGLTAPVYRGTLHQRCR